MKRLALLAATLAAVMSVPCLADEAQPKIQIAILLDTSSSMDGLINQTREQLWKIVNTFATAKRDGKRPKLELALYQYGNDTLPGSEQWIQRVVPLTTDLDRVSEALFKLRTNGGEEYCGAVIKKAMSGLEWSSDKHDLKLIYIAGNEPFTQGPVDFHQSVKDAIAHGIVVNTIHAGSEADGVSGGWKDAAVLADGSFMTIDQNRAVARVDAPQDQEIAKLNAQLNQTYIAYGSSGKEAAARQVAQDSNAKGMSAGAMSARAASKASANYDNSGWDLVDAKKKGESVAAMPAAALPVEMQKMAPKEREEFVAKKESERAEIQGKIAKLAKDRDSFVQAELKKQASSGPKTLDDALIESAKVQAKKQNFAF